MCRTGQGSRHISWPSEKYYLTRFLCRSTDVILTPVTRQERGISAVRLHARGLRAVSLCALGSALSPGRAETRVSLRQSKGIKIPGKEDT